MKVDIEHLHYWMSAIRESKDPIRTLDAFWQGQLRSKQWLIENLEHYIYPEVNKTLDFPISVDVYGGWVGVLSSMLFQSDIPISKIRSIDIDPVCESIATTMNKKEEIEGRFQAITANMCYVGSEADLIINTSCEHISQDEYDTWLDILPKKSIIVLQSNDYNIEEHIRTAVSIDDFISQSKINVLTARELELPLYKRFMIIGEK